MKISVVVMLRIGWLRVASNQYMSEIPSDKIFL